MFFERSSLRSDDKKPKLLTHLQPTQSVAFPGEAPSAWLSRAHRSGRTTSPSFYSAGLCTGLPVGWKECGNIAAGGSWPPPDAGPSSEEPGFVQLRWECDHERYYIRLLFISKQLKWGLEYLLDTRTEQAEWGGKPSMKLLKHKKIKKVQILYEINPYIYIKAKRVKLLYSDILRNNKSKVSIPQSGSMFVFKRKQYAEKR